MPALEEKFNEMRNVLNANLIEREEVVEGTILALISRKHAFLLGPPGTAKSLTIDYACRQIAGARYFRKLLTKDTQREELFGPFSISKLKQDQFERKTVGYVPEADVVFLDEVFKASSSILNTTLTLMNERLFENGIDEDSTPASLRINNVPLVSLFGASNELPQDDGLAAFYDRFLMRFYVADIHEDSSFRQLLDLPEFEPRPVVKLTELHRAQKAAASLPTGDVSEILTSLRAKLREAGLTYSTRRWKESLAVLRAHAWLRGGDSVADRDLTALQSILWTKPEDSRTILSLILSVTNPDLQKAYDLLDLATETYNNAKQETGASEVIFEAIDKIKSTIPEFNKLSNGPEITAAKDRVREFINDLSREFLGVD